VRPLGSQPFDGVNSLRSAEEAPKNYGGNVCVEHGLDYNARMRRVSFAALVIALAEIAAACSGGTSTGGPSLVPIGAGIRGAKGLAAGVYATGLRQMSAFAFDRRGRLWVATSGATSHTRDAVYVLSAAHARPRRVITGLRGPLGLLWYGSRLYVASLGRVTMFGGLQGSRFAIRRTIVDGPVRNGENNGLALAPTGRILMAVSASCDHCVPASRFSGSIVSFRADGSDLRIYARRIRAAYGLELYPGTATLFATSNQRDDLGAATPGDELDLVRAGADFKFPGCYRQAGAACAGVPAPVAVLDKHAAAGGVAIVTNELGGGVAPSAFVAEWQLGRVKRVALRRSTTGFSGTVSTFLVGIEHPLPIATTASGAILVGDWQTGTIYRIARAR
jgi:glucose/arabinose dehydrogenase